MKSSGSLRYIDDFTLLKNLMEYVRATNFAQNRTDQFDKKYYTDYFLPTIYRNYDLPCKFFLDSAYTNHPAFMKTLQNHRDILSGIQADQVRQEVGGALMLRLERLRASLTAYRLAIANCIRLKELLDQYLQ